MTPFSRRTGIIILKVWIWQLSYHQKESPHSLTQRNGSCRAIPLKWERAESLSPESTGKKLSASLFSLVWDCRPWALTVQACYVCGHLLRRESNLVYRGVIQDLHKRTQKTADSHILQGRLGKLPDCQGCRGAAGHTVPPNPASSVGGGPTLAEGFCGHMQIHSVNIYAGLSSEKKKLLLLWIPNLNFCAD